MSVPFFFFFQTNLHLSSGVSSNLVLCLTSKLCHMANTWRVQWRTISVTDVTERSAMLKAFVQEWVRTLMTRRLAKDFPLSRSAPSLTTEICKSRSTWPEPCWRQSRRFQLLCGGPFRWALGSVGRHDFTRVVQEKIVTRWRLTDHRHLWQQWTKQTSARSPPVPLGRGVLHGVGTRDGPPRRLLAYTGFLKTCLQLIHGKLPQAEKRRAGGPTHGEDHERRTSVQADRGRHTTRTDSRLFFFLGPRARFETLEKPPPPPPSAGVVSHPTGLINDRQGAGAASSSGALPRFGPLLVPVVLRQNSKNLWR